MVTHTMSNSLATLCNIGNSCYMNSVLYTLRFAPNFTHNLHHLVEFLELVLHKANTDKKYIVHHDENAQNELNVMNSKPKSSLLDHNATSGSETVSAHTWSGKDLIHHDRNVNGYEKLTTNRTTLSSNGSGALSEISFGDNDKCSVLSSPTHICNSCSAAKPTCAGDNCNRSKNSEISYSNGSGTKSNRQLVCETLHELFHSLARNEASDVIEPFHAGGLLEAVQSVSSTFEGNQQQDAHEFLMCILDSVRESCQILNKHLIENPDILKISPVQTLEKAASTDVTINNSNATAVNSESKLSNTQFIARNIFRRRKESLKNNTKSSIKEVRYEQPANTVVSVQPASASTCVHNCMGKQKINLPNTTTGGGQEPSVAQERLKQRIRTLGLNFFCEDFEGVTVSRTRCLSCETVTEQKETMIDIAIPITSSEVSDAVKNPQQFYQDACITQEYFRGDNKYRCEVCSGYTEACRTISFDILPRLLVLQLKRFNGDMEKINSYIPTPFILQCFCAECIGKSDSEKRHIYRLYSVITHVGARMSVGHYIAYTSSLQIPLHYINCLKDRQRRALLAAASFETQHNLHASDGMNNAGGISSKNQSSSAEKRPAGQLKKLFGSKKTSSAGDISKKLKNNVINRFSPINGMESLQLNANADSSLEKPAKPGYMDNFYGTHSIDAGMNHAQGAGDFLLNGSETGTGLSCQSIGCCAVLTKAMLSNDIMHPASGNGRCFIDDDLVSENTRNGSAHNMSPLTTGSICNNNCVHNHYKLGASNGEDRSSIAACHGSLFSNAVNNDDNNKGLSYGNVVHETIANQQLTWYMCDDDKIKIMTQPEFEEVLSPNRRHVTTPYLLFYARYDVQQSQHNQSKEQTISPAQQHQQQQQPFEHKLHTALTKHVPPTTKSATISV